MPWIRTATISLSALSPAAADSATRVLVRVGRRPRGRACSPVPGVYPPGTRQESHAWESSRASSAPPTARKAAAFARACQRLIERPSAAFLVPAERRDERAPADRTEVSEPAEPIERREPADPIEPTERIDPTEPTERIDPSLPIERSEFLEPSDH